MAASGGARGADRSNPGRLPLTESAAGCSDLTAEHKVAGDLDGDGRPDVESAAALVRVLPELSMQFRRWLAYAGIALGFALAFYCAGRASEGTLYIIALGGLAAVLLFTLLYMDGARSGDLARLTAAAGLVGQMIERARRPADPYGSAYADTETDFDADPGALLQGLAPEAGPRMEG